MINKQINYLIIAYAFSFPVSKAVVNVLEIVILLLWIYQGNWKEKFGLLQSSMVMKLLALFIVYNILSVFWASDWLFALQYIGKYHHFLLIPVIYTVLEKKYVSSVFTAYILSVFISELLSYGIYFHLFTLNNATPEFPTPFMHHITYSIVLAFTSTMLLINFFTEKKRIYKIFNLLFFVTVSANLFINGGRTGQVAYMILMFLLPFFYIKQKFKAFLFAFSLIGISFYLAYNYSDNFVSRIDQLDKGVQKMVQENDYTDQGGMRAALWVVGVDEFLQHPLLGTGIGNEMKNANTHAASHHFKTKNMNEFADYHNIFVNEAVQLGTIGLLLLLFVFIALFRLPFQMKQYSVLNKMFVISFIIFSMTHNTLHLMNPMVFFTLFVGLFSAISRLESETKNTF